MALHAYLALTRTGPHGRDEVLLAQKNIYLPPWGKYQYATIAGHAGQFLLPGGQAQPGEQAVDAAVREFYEDTGLQLPPDSLQPLLDDGSRCWAFQARLEASHLDLDSINAGLPHGRFGSLKFIHMTWCPLEEAPARLGRQDATNTLPWVALQITRALQAGFSRDLIGMRANEPHTFFTRALAKLMLDAFVASTPSALPAEPPSQIPASASAS